MSETTLHTVLIKRTNIGVLRNYCDMKNIKIKQILHNDHGELKDYEPIYKRKLTKMDAIIISPLSESEINDITNGYYTNEELLTYERKINEERLARYKKNFGKLLE